MFFHIFRDRSQRDGPRDIRRTGQILSAGIHQEHPLRRKLRVGDTGDRFVVHHGRVGAVSGDRGEREIHIVVDLRAQIVEIRRGAGLCHRLRARLSDRLRDPHDKSAQRCAVALVAGADIRHLHGIFDTFEPDQGTRRPDHLTAAFTALKALSRREVDAVAHAVRVAQKVSFVVVDSKKLFQVIVSKDGNPVQSRVGPKLLRHFPVLNKEIDISVVHKYMGEGDRIAGDVRSAHIEEPHDIVQLAVNIGVRSRLLHGAAQAPEFVLDVLPGVIFLQEHHRMAGKRRPVAPDSFRKVTADLQRAFFALHELLVAPAFLAGDTAPVKSQYRTLLHILAQVLGDRRNARLSHFHERHAGAFQFRRGLDKIPAVRPQAGFLLPNDQRSRRSRKSAEKLSCVEIVRRIFRIVEIRSGDHVGVDPLSLHCCPQQFDSVSVYTAHYCLLTDCQRSALAGRLSVKSRPARAGRLFISFVCFAQA